MTRNEEIMNAAIVYANGFAQFSPMKKYCEDDFIAGAKWADSHPRWISVEDELPPKKSEHDDLSNNVLATDGKEIYESVYNYCQQITRRRWIMERKDAEYAKQAITMVYDAFLKLCEYLLAERCIEEESFAGLTDMANRAKKELGYNWALYELASHLDVACDKLAMLADAFGVVKGGEE